MVSNENKAIIKTLAYFDLFDYPLTREEIEKYFPVKISSTEFEKKLKHKKMQKKGKYFFLSGREDIVSKRLEKEKISQRKLQKAYNKLLLLKYIPSILYIGISGSLSVMNAKESDDIDLFIITKPHTLWISRLLVNSILLLSGSLRRFKQQHSKDTLCTNMWLDADHLHFGTKRQNIYTAHEIVQLLSIVNKDTCYERFLSSNEWIKEIFPNISIVKSVSKTSYKMMFLLAPIESLAEKIQLFYMHRHRTTETVTKGFVAFHPKDYTNQILQKWKEHQKKWQIQ